MSDIRSSTLTLTKQKPKRGKIEIKKIENSGSLYVTFSKRKVGLFRKASALSALYGAEVAVIIFSPHGKTYAFGHPSVDSVLSRLESANTALHGRQQNVSMHARVEEDDNDVKSSIVEFNSVQSSSMYQTRLGIVTEEMDVDEVTVDMGGGRFWWDQPIHNMNLQKLKLFKTSLEELKDKVCARYDDLSMRELALTDYLGVH